MGKKSRRANRIKRSAVPKEERIADQLARHNAVGDLHDMVCRSGIFDAEMGKDNEYQAMSTKDKEDFKRYLNTMGHKDGVKIK